MSGRAKKSYEQCDPNLNDLKRTDCATLQGKEMLRTGAIVAILAMFKHESVYDRRVWIQSPDLLQKMLRIRDTSWHRWCDRNGLNLFETQVVIFPVCIGMHWSFFRVFVLARQIDCVTSLGSEPRGVRQHVVRYMARKGWWPSSRLRSVTKSPTQENGFDCGVFLVAGIERVMHNQPLDYDQEAITLYRPLLQRRYASFCNSIVLSYHHYYKYYYYY
jgi:hypothetical protein